MHVCLNNILLLDSVNHHIFTSINYLWLSNLRVGGYFGILRFCTLQDLFVFTVTFTCQIGMSLVYHTSQTKYAKKQWRSADFQNVQVQQKTMWQFVIFDWLSPLRGLMCQGVSSQTDTYEYHNTHSAHQKPSTSFFNPLHFGWMTTSPSPLSFKCVQ